MPTNFNLAHKTSKSTGNTKVTNAINYNFYPFLHSNIILLTCRSLHVPKQVEILKQVETIARKMVRL